MLIGQSREYFLISSSCFKRKFVKNNMDCNKKVKVSFAKSMFQEMDEVSCKNITSSGKNNLNLTVIQLENSVKRRPLEISPEPVKNNYNLDIWSLRKSTSSKDHHIIEKKSCLITNNYWATSSIDSNEDGKLYVKKCNNLNLSDGAPMTDSEGSVRAIYRNKKRVKLKYQEITNSRYKLETKKYNLSFAQDASCLNMIGSSFQKMIVSSNCVKKKTFTSIISKYIGQKIPKWIFD